MELPITKNGFTAILVFVDRLTKMVHLVSTHTDVSAEETAKLYIDNIFRHHGAQEDFVSDRDSRFTGKFWREVCNLLGTRENLSTAFHRVKSTCVVEKYLRSYVNIAQDNWDLLLPMAEYAINNSVHASTGYTPFFLNSGQHPLNPLLVGATRQEGDRGSRRASTSKNKLPAIDVFVKNVHEALHQAKVQLMKARDRQKSYADQTRREMDFSVGDKVLLRTLNLKLKTTGSRKLFPKWVGPFDVVQRIGKVAYKLGLPPSMKCHDVFHVSNLQAYRSDGRVQPPPYPIEVDGEHEYEVEQIVLHRDRKYGKRVRR
jgi:hypothetical protein